MALDTANSERYLKMVMEYAESEFLNLEVESAVALAHCISPEFAPSSHGCISPEIMRTPYADCTKSTSEEWSHVKVQPFIDNVSIRIAVEQS